VIHYAQVLPQLFFGSHPENVDDIERLRQEATITAVLNLQTDDDMRSVNLVWEPLEAYYAVCGMELRRVPVRDFDPADLREKLPACVRSLQSLLTAGHAVYLHCTAGTGRSPTVAIAYLHWCRGWDLALAVAYLKERRECSPNLDAIRQALWSDSK
jgi:protein-tyrosine phosphatase